MAYFTDDDILAVQPAAGGSVPVLLEPGAMAAWTPDSRALILTAMTGPNQYDLVRVSRDGAWRTPLTHDHLVEWNGAVSPAGNRVAYSRSVSELAPHDVWVLDLEPPPTRIVTRTWDQFKSAYRLPPGGDRPR